MYSVNHIQSYIIAEEINQRVWPICGRCLLIFHSIGILNVFNKFVDSGPWYQTALNTGLTSSSNENVWYGERKYDF